MSDPGAQQSNEPARVLPAARGCVAAGDLAGAERLLAEAARTNAGRADAELNHLLGQVLHDLGKLDRALTHYRRSLRLAPENAQLQRDLGVAYEAKAWLKEAAACYEEALRLQPADELAHAYLGRVRRAQGQLVPALRHFVRAAAIKVARPFSALSPRQGGARTQADADAARALAEARRAFDERHFAEAEARVQPLIAPGPQSPEALELYARICGKRHRAEEGISCAQQAIALRPGTPGFRVTLGELLFDIGRTDEAEASFQAALHIDAEHARACANLALVEYRRGDLEQAERYARRALAMNALSAHVNSVLGYVLLSMEKFDEAELYCRDAIRLDSSLAGAHLNLARTLKERGRIEEARSVVREGAARLSDEAASYVHLVDFESDMGEIDAAIEHARQALIVEPGHVDAHVALANLLLLSGRYEEGWPEYEWRKRYRIQERLHQGVRARLERIRQWTGGSLEGRTLLVHGEQALGEEILFSSCLGELARAAKAVTLVCDERLAGLLARSFPSIRMLALQRGEYVNGLDLQDAYDYWCALGSVPGLLKLSAKSIPPAVAYVKPDPARVQRWRERLAGLGPGLKVGLSWRGGVIATGRFKRSIDLAALRPILEVPGTHWISMQYGSPGAEIARLREQAGITLAHWQDGIDDLEEHAALDAALDHRVSVCNTFVHLSGATGLRTWVLSPPTTIWPYGLGERMPWYPSVAIYRQRSYKDWSEPVAAVARDLRGLAAAHSAGKIGLK